MVSCDDGKGAREGVAARKSRQGQARLITGAYAGQYKAAWHPIVDFYHGINSNVDAKSYKLLVIIEAGGAQDGKYTRC